MASECLSSGAKMYIFIAALRPINLRSTMLCTSQNATHTIFPQTAENGLHSPVLVLSHFHFFGSLRENFKGKHF
jgi:hypothetical protein